jgi:hypothetical protein
MPPTIVVARWVVWAKLLQSCVREREWPPTFLFLLVLFLLLRPMRLWWNARCCARGCRSRSISVGSTKASWIVPHGAQRSVLFLWGRGVHAAWRLKHDLRVLVSLFVGQDHQGRRLCQPVQGARARARDYRPVHRFANDLLRRCQASPSCEERCVLGPLDLAHFLPLFARDCMTSLWWLAAPFGLRL